MNTDNEERIINKRSEGFRIIDFIHFIVSFKTIL